MVSKKTIKKVITRKCEKCGRTVKYTLLDAENHVYRCIVCGNKIVK